MARKSRTQPKQSTDTLKALSKVYKTAIYVRLSAEKDETRDRKTLINQRKTGYACTDTKRGILPIKMSGMFLKIIILHLLQRNSSMRYRRTKER